MVCIIYYDGGEGYVTTFVTSYSGMSKLYHQVYILMLHDSMHNLR